MQRDKERNYYSLSPLHLHPKLGGNRLSLTLMHSPLVVLEAMVVDSNDRGARAAIKHRAVIRGGGISLNNILIPNLLSDRTTSNNTISCNVNEFTTHHRNVDLGGHMTTGRTPAVGIRRNLHPPLTHPWGLFLDVVGAAS